MITLFLSSLLCYSLLTMYCFFALWAFQCWENYNVRHDEVTVAAAHFQFCAGEAVIKC